VDYLHLLKVMHLLFLKLMHEHKLHKKQQLKLNVMHKQNVMLKC